MSEPRLTPRQRLVLEVLVDRGDLPIPLGSRSRPYHALLGHGYAAPWGRLGYLRATDEGRARLARERGGR